ncbi:hypothetical protein ACFL0O_10505, partial [Thermodesulfobacteriota bacterium]
MTVFQFHHIRYCYFYKTGEDHPFIRYLYQVNPYYGHDFMAFRKSFKLALPILLVFLLAGLAGIGISALQKKNSETMKYNHAFLIGINNYDH